MTIHPAIYKSAALASSIILAGGYIWFRSGAPLPFREPAKVNALPAHYQQLSSSKWGAVDVSTKTIEEPAPALEQPRTALMPSSKVMVPTIGVRETRDKPALSYSYDAGHETNPAPDARALLQGSSKHGAIDFSSQNVLIGAGTVEFRDTPDKPDNTKAPPTTFDLRELYLNWLNSSAFDFSTPQHAPRREFLSGVKSISPVFHAPRTGEQLIYSYDPGHTSEEADDGLKKQPTTETPHSQKPVPQPPPAPRTILLPGPKSWYIAPADNKQLFEDIDREIKELEEMARKLNASKTTKQPSMDDPKQRERIKQWFAEEKKAEKERKLKEYDETTVRPARPVRDVLQFSSKSAPIDFSSIDFSTPKEKTPVPPWWRRPRDQETPEPSAQRRELLSGSKSTVLQTDSIQQQIQEVFDESLKKKWENREQRPAPAPQSQKPAPQPQPTPRDTLLPGSKSFNINGNGTVFDGDIYLEFIFGPEQEKWTPRE